MISEFSDEDFAFNKVEGSSENWDNVVYETKNDEKLGAYYLMNAKNYVYEYIVAVNSIAYEA